MSFEHRVRTELESVVEVPEREIDLVILLPPLRVLAQEQPELLREIRPPVGGQMQPAVPARS